MATRAACPRDSAPMVHGTAGGPGPAPAATAAAPSGPRIKMRHRLAL